MEILRCTSGGADLWDGLDWTEEELVKQNSFKNLKKINVKIVLKIFAVLG
jgi:hypothetical protein